MGDQVIYFEVKSMFFFLLSLPSLLGSLENRFWGFRCLNLRSLVWLNEVINIYICIFCVDDILNEDSIVFPKERGNNSLVWVWTEFSLRCDLRLTRGYLFLGKIRRLVTSLTDVSSSS